MYAHDAGVDGSAASEGGIEDVSPHDAGGNVDGLDASDVLDASGALDAGDDAGSMPMNLPPELVDAFPAHGASDVAVVVSVQLAFSKAMSRERVEGAFSMEASDGSPVSGSFAWSSGDTVLAFTPTAELTAATGYTVVLDDGAEDAEGLSLNEVVVLEFTTAAVTKAGDGVWNESIWNVDKWQ